MPDIKGSRMGGRELRVGEGVTGGTYNNSMNVQMPSDTLGNTNIEN